MQHLQPPVDAPLLLTLPFIQVFLMIFQQLLELEFFLLAQTSCYFTLFRFYNLLSHSDIG